MMGLRKRGRMSPTEGYCCVSHEWGNVTAKETMDGTTNKRLCGSRMYALYVVVGVKQHY